MRDRFCKYRSHLLLLRKYTCIVVSIGSAGIPPPHVTAANTNMDQSTVDDHVLSEELGECLRDDVRLFRMHGWCGLETKRAGGSTGHGRDPQTL